MKNIFILGSTGSIGKNTLEVISQHPDKFNVKVLVTNTNVQLLSEQIKQFKPEIAVVFDERAYKKFINEKTIENTKIFYGLAGIKQALQINDIDVFLNAFVGFSGFIPTIEAIKRNLDIALANKETLVVAGKYVTDLIKQYDVDLLPIDSEHGAIWQCLRGEEKNEIKRIILTASGGPFRTLKIEELNNVTVQQALNHPNWNMGSKITIDSATMMNKGLEVIEVFWLYNVPVNKIEVIIHPQSIIHSMVEFTDNSIKAQLGIPDMKLPIQYALAYPDRLPLKMKTLNFDQVSELTFEVPDYTKFPCLRLAFDAISKGDTYPAVLNASNEVAVEAFLNEQIKFTDIANIIEKSLNIHQPIQPSCIEDYLDADKKGRETANNIINMKQF